MINNTSYINEFIGDQINEFLNEKKKKSNNTYVSYKGSLNKIFKDLFNITDLKFITKSHIESLNVKVLNDYFNEMHDELDNDDLPKYKNATITKHISVIKGLINYLYEDDVIEYSVKKLNRLTPYPDTREEIEMIPFELAMKYAKYFRGEEQGLEKELIIKLAIETALRAQELLSLRWSNFILDKESGDVIMKSHGDNKGKGNKEWIDKIDKKIYEELLQLKDIGNTDKLFTLTYKQLAGMMDRGNELLNDTGTKYTFHSFKKLAVTMCYLNSNNCIDTAQKKARHSNVNTTMRYLRFINSNVTGIMSSIANTDNEIYKTVSHEVLLECLGEMRQDVLAILNAKINAKLNK